MVYLVPVHKVIEMKKINNIPYLTPLFPPLNGELWYLFFSIYMMIISLVYGQALFKLNYISLETEL